jgi:hypothetical protein
VEVFVATTFGWLVALFIVASFVGWLLFEWITADQTRCPYCGYESGVPAREAPVCRRCGRNLRGRGDARPRRPEGGEDATAARSPRTGNHRLHRFASRRPSRTPTNDGLGAGPRDRSPRHAQSLRPHARKEASSTPHCPRRRTSPARQLRDTPKRRPASPPRAHLRRTLQPSFPTPTPRRTSPRQAGTARTRFLRRDLEPFKVRTRRAS